MKKSSVVMQDYHIVDNVKKLKELSKRRKTLEEFAFDTETKSLQVAGKSDELQIVAMSISWGSYDNYYIPIAHRRYEDIKRNIRPIDIKRYLKSTFEQEEANIIGHNIKCIF